ncbi:hypothetical protein [Sphaerisporangium aureirubrum]|uniref:Fatty acid desaturase domain-containing protein n=1 Tax=Sphaerisporangium aureirubrum TaxID=1544736 RepID=A0ABW1NUL3_9ACTN
MNVSMAGLGAGLWTTLRHRAVTRHWALSDALFAEIDGFAWVQGWAIDRHRTHHTYRDPRFDRVVACFTCGGDGAAQGRACATCEGAGLLNFFEPPAPRRG